MILGVILRLMVSALFFFAAWYALRPEQFSALLRDLEERFDRPKESFDRAHDYLPRVKQGLYVLSALYLIFAGSFLYHHLRRLSGEQDPLRRTLPYTRPVTGNQPYGRYYSGSTTAQPYAGQAAPQSGAQPYSRTNPGSGQPYTPPAGSAQPYSR